MNIVEKYQSNRHLVNHGDFILFSGTGIVASTIKEADNSKFSHIGLIIEVCGRFLIIDSNARGNHPAWLSSRVESANWITKSFVIKNKQGKIENLKKTTVLQILKKSTAEPPKGKRILEDVAEFLLPNQRKKDKEKPKK